ncbi:MAG: hypothetical protein D5S00_01785 [Tindallia sp. MSAO_Bac2]|nr:MAG: hypothetical protein D5S00_01785 [Tindallia sp. MSAO_Bac2]
MRKISTIFSFIIILILLGLMVWQQWEMSQLQQEVNLLRKETEKYERYLARYQEDFQLIYQGTRAGLTEEQLNDERDRMRQSVSEDSYTELLKQLKMREEDQQASFWIPGQNYGLIVFQYYGVSSDEYTVRSVMTRPYHLHVYLENINSVTFDGNRQGQVMVIKLDGDYQQQFLQILKW